MQEKPDVMHPLYPDFLQFIDNYPHRPSAECKQMGFWVFLKMREQCIALLTESEPKTDVGGL
jgi:hypothetical protein